MTTPGTGPRIEAGELWLIEKGDGDARLALWPYDVCILCACLGVSYGELMAVMDAEGQRPAVAQEVSDEARTVEG